MDPSFYEHTLKVYTGKVFYFSVKDGMILQVQSGARVVILGVRGGGGYRLCCSLLADCNARS